MSAIGFTSYEDMKRRMKADASKHWFLTDPTANWIRHLNKDLDDSERERVKVKVDAINFQVKSELAKVNQRITILEGLEKRVDAKLKSMGDKIDKFEAVFGRVFPLVEEKRKTNAHLNKVLSEIENALNQ